MPKKSRASKPAPVDPSTIPGVKRGIPEPTPQEQAAQAAKRGPLSTPAGIEPTGNVVQMHGSTSKFSLTSTQAADLLGISNSTLLRKMVELDFPRRKMGTRYRFNPDDIPAMSAKLFNEEPLPPISVDASDLATNPVVDRMREERPQLFRGFTDDDWLELYSAHGDGGALTESGVEELAKRIHWKRSVRAKIEVILESDQANTFAGIVDAVHKQVSARR